ncbi:MAG TPA: hypothetical protein P5048_02350 [Chlamydiales bacterium]|nr:hypothetical protein [Chlamydiales bacterium]
MKNKNFVMSITSIPDTQLFSGLPVRALIQSGEFETESQIEEFVQNFIDFLTNCFSHTTSDQTENPTLLQALHYIDSYSENTLPTIIAKFAFQILFNQYFEKDIPSSIILPPDITSSDILPSEVLTRPAENNLCLIYDIDKENPYKASLKLFNPNFLLHNPTICLSKILKGYEIIYQKTDSKDLEIIQDTLGVVQEIRDKEEMIEFKKETCKKHAEIYEKLPQWVAEPPALFGTRYIFQKFYPATLRSHLQDISLYNKKPLDILSNFQLLLLIMQGIEAHKKEKIIHSDLKGSNILITDDGHPYITDYDLACSVEPTEAIFPHHSYFQDYGYWPIIAKFGISSHFTDTYTLFLPLTSFLLTFDLNYFEYFMHPNLSNFLHYNYAYLISFLYILQINCINNHEKIFEAHQTNTPLSDHKQLSHISLITPELITSIASISEHPNLVHQIILKRINRLAHLVEQKKELLSEKFSEFSSLSAEEKRFYEKLHLLTEKVENLFVQIMTPLIKKDYDYLKEFDPYLKALREISKHSENPDSPLPPALPDISTIRIDDPFDEYLEIFKEWLRELKSSFEQIDQKHPI